ncbi:MAG: restriction endonuclease subunit S, partial [Eubacteriales bacterium]|nr:restriction endonuclease subunit S [Eubacteriales bacterium]
MNKWKEVRLCDIGKIITGKTPKTKIKENYGGNILFLTPSDDMICKYIINTNKKITLIGLK